VSRHITNIGQQAPIIALVADVLLVEDNESDEMLALRTIKLSAPNVRVDVARDGVQAVEYLLDPNRECPRLVLLDLKLPLMNGLEVLRKIRTEPKTRRVPVVCLTSSAEPPDLFGCYDSGANSYVTKATAYEDYTARMQKLVEYWLTVNEPCT